MPYSKKHALAAAAAVALLTFPNALQASQPYDGNWSVRAFPNSRASCEGNYQLRVQVSEGAVTYVGRGAIHAIGGIQADGILKVAFHADGDRLDARGTMSGPGTGRGTWKSAADDCHGTWIARRT